MGTDTITDYYLELYNFKIYVNAIHNKQSEGEIHEGYFVDKKKYDFLENQVNYYYQKQRSKSLANKSKSESNDEDLEQIKKLKMDTKSVNELKQSLSKGEEFILINQNLYHYICKEKEENKINKVKYTIKSNNLIILNKADNTEIARFKIDKNNIISGSAPLNNIGTQIRLNNNPNDVNKIFLNHLLKYEYFKKDIYAFRNTQMGYALDSQIIKKLVSMHNLGEKLGILNTQANRLTYQNFENYYTHILKILNQNNIAPIDIQSLNSINEIRNPLIPKKVGNLLYLDNFALIDKDFGYFLYKISNKSIKMHQVLYTSIGTKIVMSINYDYSNIYQIVSFQNDDFIAEYIIGISYNQYSNDIKHIHNLIASTILTQGPQNLNILKNGILVNNCFKFFLHELNNINKNLPNTQGINSSQKLENIIKDKSLGKSTSVPIIKK